jgi:hypothetical protein
MTPHLVNLPSNAPSARDFTFLKLNNHFIAQAFDFPDGVPFGDPGIHVDHRHKLPLRLLPASHEPFYSIRIVNTRFLFCFSAVC